MWHLVRQGGAKACRRNHQEDYTGWHSNQRTVPRRHWAEFRGSTSPLLKGWWYLLLTALADTKEITMPRGQALSNPRPELTRPTWTAPTATSMVDQTRPRTTGWSESSCKSNESIWKGLPPAGTWICTK